MKKILGLLLAPLLYARYSFILFSPFAIYAMTKTNDYSTILEVWLFVWFVYAVFFGVIMGNFGIMHYWSKLWCKILRVKYEIIENDTSDEMYLFSVWSHPILKVKGKEYQLSIAVMGGNLYEEDDNIRRKAIIYYLFK